MEIASPGSPVDLQPPEGLNDDHSWRIITQYLANHNNTAEEAVSEIMQLLTAESCRLDEDDRRHPCTVVDCVWATCLIVVTRITWDHEYHDKLVTLLEVIKRQPSPPDEVATCLLAHVCCDASVFDWEELHGFAWAEFRDSYMPVEGRPPLVVEGSVITWSIAQWTSWNKFMALLLARDVFADTHPLQADLIRDAMFILHPTLELDRKEEGIEIDFPAAAVWLLAAGEWFAWHLGLQANTAVHPFLRRFGNKQYIYSGSEETISLERWRFWNQTLNRLTKTRHVGSLGRTIASHAVANAERTGQQVWDTCSISTLDGP